MKSMSEKVDGGVAPIDELPVCPDLGCRFHGIRLNVSDRLWNTALGSSLMERVIASWFGSGLILGRIRGSDSGSGTLASLITLPIALWVGSNFGWEGQLAAAGILILASYWASRRLVESEGDAGWIVIDEAAGTFVATIGLTLAPALVASFVVFRAADIFKVPGVKEAERLKGALGVTADDVVAGIYGLALGHLLQLTVL